MEEGRDYDRDDEFVPATSSDVGFNSNFEYNIDPLMSPAELYGVNSLSLRDMPSASNFIAIDIVQKALHFCL